MTVSSIRAGKAGGYARYLESKTIDPEQGDYYLSPTGEPAQAPGKWLARADTLADLGIDGEPVDGPDFIALMEGRHPHSGEWLRSVGAGGGRGGGIDLTFSAPKSVSALWALGDETRRVQIESAHAAAVSQAIEHLREHVPTVRRKLDGHVIEEHAADLIAAEYRHTTARGAIEGGVPDPQLHSHVVITSAVREDGRTVAVASRPIFRSARELGAYYRSALAHELSERGFQIERGTGKDGRYFEIAGVPKGLRDAFSQRTREVERAAERFRAKWGRAPERGELRALKLENRKAKALVTKGDLKRSWEETAAPFSFHERQPRDEHPARGFEQGPEAALEERIERRLTEQAATFTPGELRAVALEQSAGELPPAAALTLTRTVIAERRVLPLQGGLMTTLAQRAREQAIERRLSELAGAADRDVGEEARAIAGDEVAERIGARLGVEQERALLAISGPERAAMLIGPAGTGKGVVIDAAARAEQLAGARTFGIAVAGDTAQRLGRESPALSRQTLTLNSLVARAEHGSLDIGPDTTIYFDEAGMADSERLDNLTKIVVERGAKLVLIGDSAQLPSIGAGGMFERLEAVLPRAELSEVRRTLDPDEQRAWADLRAGRSDRAMAHYYAKGRLHFSDTRDRAGEHAVNTWASLTEQHPLEEIALIADASNREIDRLNARAQHRRAERGELGELEVEIPGTHYGLREGDRVALAEQHREHGGGGRVENGERGEVVDVSELGEVTVQFDVTGRTSTFAGEDLGKLRLGYAQHIHRAQGATVTRTLVVTGGWQTSKEPAYVEASRAREGTDWFVAREELGFEGQDVDRVMRLAEGMGRSRAQVPSLDFAELAWMPVEGASVPLPGLARAPRQVVKRSAADRGR